MARGRELLVDAGASLKKGDFAECATLFENAGDALREEGALEDERQALLGAAEARWQLGDKTAALVCYDRALGNAVDAGDKDGEAQVLLGKGFALMSIGEGGRAVESLERSAALADSLGHTAQARFIENMLLQARAMDTAGPRQKDALGGEVAERGASNESARTADGGDGPGDGADAGVIAPPGGYAVKLAFAQSIASKAPVVLVMKGSPDSPACSFSAAVVESLQKLGLRFEHCDVTHDSEMQAAFKEAMALPTFPMLLVAGGLWGGSDIVLEEQRQGSLRASLEEALQGHLGEEQIAALFVPHDTQPSSSSSATCHSKHLRRLVRMVAFVALKVRRGGDTLSLASEEAGADSDTRGPSAETRVAEYLRGTPPHGDGPHAPHGDAAEGAASSAFVAHLSASLGGFSLPEDLLVVAPSVGEVAAYVETHCPAQGDCSKCPTKVTCEVHTHEEGEGGVVDIEDGVRSCKASASLDHPARAAGLVDAPRLGEIS